MPEGNQIPDMPPEIITCPECDFGWTEKMGERHAAGCSKNIHNEIARRFTYHAPTPDQIPKYNRIRMYAREFAEMLLHECPSCRERSLALTKLEEAVMWANAAIARRS